MGLFDRFKKQPQAEAVPDKPDASTIVPRIKNLAFLQALEQHGVPRDQWPHTALLTADLLVTYAFDLPDTFPMVMPHDLQRLGLASDRLHEIAMNNLRQQIQEIGRKGEPPLLEVTVGGDLEACILLVDEFWNVLKDKIPGEIVAAAPARDVLLVTSSQSEKGIQLMRERTAEAFAAGEDHALSTNLLVRRDGGWIVFDESEGPETSA